MKALLLTVTLLLTGALTAPPAEAGPRPGAHDRLWVVAQDDWNTLDPQEQRLLREHRKQWQSYSPDQRARLRSGAQRYRNLSDAERRNVERERERYERMTPQERKALREEYRKSRDHR
jgi:hypothetical protein